MSAALIVRCLGVLLASVAVIAAADAAPDDAAQKANADPDAQFPRHADPQLIKGRQIWLGTCKACHATGLADAPPVHDKSAWRPRLAKGREVLQQHALQGFFGAQGTMMPPRGGNDKLSDDEVKAAVDYMIEIVK